MNTSTLWIIVLAFWIFLLQNRVKRLEAVVEGLKKGFTSDKPKPKEKPKQDQSTVTKKIPLPKPITLNKSIKKSIPKKEVPQEPSKIISFIKDYFTGGNILVRVGSIILFFGLAFLVKYATEHTHISIELRLSFIAFVSLALVMLGWKLRHREGAYGQVLQGLGIAIFYLLIYTASKFYTLLSLDIAFILMLGVVILGSTLAVIEDALPLALFSTMGGFLVPLLTSSGEGSHILLFSYYAILNLGVFSIAWYRSWRFLNIVGFLFTFVISGYWGILRYSPELFYSTEPFLLLYFAMYLTISILFTIKHPYKPKNLVDATLVFGLPVIAFPLQLKLVSLYEYGNAYSAVILGWVYLVLYFLLKNKEKTKLLAQSFLALGVVFLSISIPYIFNADVSSLLWLLESVGIIWLALKQDKKISRYFGELLLFIALFTYTLSVQTGGITLVEYLGYIILILAVLFGSYLLDTFRPKLHTFDRFYAKVLFLMTFVLWFSSTPSQLIRFNISYTESMLWALILLLPLLLLLIRYTQWKMLIQTIQGYFPLGLLFSLPIIIEKSHPFQGLGFFLFLSFIASNYFLLLRYNKISDINKIFHILSLWFVIIIGSLELLYFTELLSSNKNILALSIIILPLITSVLLLYPKLYKGWLEAYRPTYQLIGAGGLVLFEIWWTILAFGLVLPKTQNHIPLLNLLDVTQILVLGSIYYWGIKNHLSFNTKTPIRLYALLIFLSAMLINVIYARSIYYFTEVSYTLSSLWQNAYFQTGLSILWSSIAIILMLLSKKYLNRPLWMAGFGLLILVVLKLFFIELAQSGTIERIVSFMVVGTLLLVIGYFVPLPPSEDEK